MRIFFYIIAVIFPLNLLYSQCDGDANQDEIVNVQDIVVIVSHILDGNDLEVPGTQTDFYAKQCIALWKYRRCIYPQTA